MRSLSAVRTSTQDVCPPTSILSRSGVGKDPRTPQNFIICSAMMKKKSVNNLPGFKYASQEISTMEFGIRIWDCGTKMISDE